MRTWSYIPVRGFPFIRCLGTIQEQYTIMVVSVWSTGTGREIGHIYCQNEHFTPKNKKPDRKCIHNRQEAVYTCRCVRRSEPVD
jgi:hypothetical protein